MKKPAIAALALLSLALAACDPSISSIDVAPAGRWTLQRGDAPAEAYEGTYLPDRGDATDRVEYRFARTFRFDPAEYPNGPSLVVGPSGFPYRAYVNGRLELRFGDALPGGSTRSYGTYVAPLDPADLRTENELVIVGDVGLEREPLPDVAIADFEAGSNYAFFRDYLMKHLSNSGIVLGAMLFAYFLTMYLLGKRSDKRFLWFGVFCAFFALVCVNLSWNGQGADDTLLTKASRLGLFGSATFMSFYLMEVTATLHRRRWLKLAMGGAMAIGAGLVIAQGDAFSTNRVFHYAMHAIITPNIAFSVLLLARGVIKQGLRRHWFMVVGFGGVLATSFHDMQWENALVMPYSWLLCYGYLWLVVWVFMELAIEQNEVARKATAQADELNKNNGILRSVFRHLKEGSDTLKSSTEDLAVSTREISLTGNQQAAAVREIVATMEDAGALLSKVSGRSGLVRQDADETARKAEEGARAVNEALRKLEGVISKIAQSISLITEFDEQLGSIKDVVKLIEGIATQIRIIAFNASLEAVAAGEAGSNFRIVADEVKRLADSTMASVKSIRERVNALVAKSDDVVQVARDGYSSLEQSWDIASGMGDSFSGIAAAAESSAKATADIDASIREETGAFDQIVRTLKEISSGITSFVDSASHTSETTRRLDGIAETLHALIAKYSSNDGEPEGANGEPGVGGA